MEDKLICEVCKKNEAVGVASSAVGPVSLAYCKTCLDWMADALWVIASSVYCCDGPEHMAEWFWDMRTFRDGLYISAAQVYGRQATMDLI
jgi:hypothetical protein